jgi:hypothetical protein
MQVFKVVARLRAFLLALASKVILAFCSPETDDHISISNESESREV